MIIVFLIGCTFFLSSKAYAIDFTITNSSIDARLLDNGYVEVVETHMYEFDDDFNGLTRTLYPKEGTQIVDFTASEDGAPLEVVQEDELYKIYRAGSHEAIEVEFTYLIENGVDMYSDAADFYWAFFDSSNETPYEDMTITVYPPQKTEDVIAFGFDETFDKESIQSDGSVVFELGQVPSGTNGDIRVAYPPELFPTANGSSESKWDEILTQEQEGKDEAAAFSSRQQALSTFASAFIPIFGYPPVSYYSFLCKG